MSKKHYPEDHIYLSKFFKGCSISYINEGAYSRIYGITEGEYHTYIICLTDSLPKYIAIKLAVGNDTCMPYSFITELCNVVEHPHIIKYIGIVQGDNRYALVMRGYRGNLRDIYIISS